MEESKDLKSILTEIESSNPSTLKKISQRHISKAKILNKGSRYTKGELRGKEYTLENGLKITIKFDESVGKKAQNFVFINGGLAKAKDSLKEIRTLLKNERLSVKEKRAALSLKKALEEYIEYRTKTNKANKQKSKVPSKNQVKKVNPLYLKEITEKIDAFYARDLSGLSEEEKKAEYDKFIEELKEEKRKITAESVTYREELNKQLERLELLKSTTSDYTSQSFIDNLQEIANSKNATMPVIENMAAATDLINKTIDELRPKAVPRIDTLFMDDPNPRSESFFYEEDENATNSERYKVNFHYIGRYFFRELDRSQRRLLRQTAYAVQRYGRDASAENLNPITRFFAGLPLKSNNQRAMRSLDLDNVDIFELFDYSDEDVERLSNSGYLLNKLFFKKAVRRMPTPEVKLPDLDEKESSQERNPDNNLEEVFEDLAQ